MGGLRTRALTRTAQQRLAMNCPFKLRMARSAIHHFGVFAREDIPPHRKILEYTGERITRKETRRRYLRGWRGDPNLNYLACLDRYWAIDGSVGGSGAELVNHSCGPNTVLRRFKGHLLLFSLREIRTGEELTYDYEFPRKGDRVACHCGSPKCRGTINRP
jgi:SET domain-containing protein